MSRNDELYAQLREKKGCGYVADQPESCRCGADTFRTATSPNLGMLAVGCRRTNLWLCDELDPEDTYHDDAVEALIS